MSIQIGEDGEANFYTLSNPTRWVARVQLNGEFMAEKQQQIMLRFAYALSGMDLNRLTQEEIDAKMVARFDNDAAINDEANDL